MTPSLDLGSLDPALGGVIVSGPRLVLDSREVATGDVFVAVGREGLEFADAAVARGASSVLYDPATGAAPRNGVAVEQLAAKLGDIADAFAGHPSRDLSLVGVTGTNGKTSTVQLVSQAWHTLGLSSASIGTLGAGVYGDVVGTGLTTPPVTRVHELLADFRERGVRNVAIEVSSHALEQGRVAGARFDVVAFTNLTRDHLDYHGTMEAYAAAKARIFDLPGEPAAVINLDDPRGVNFAAAVGARAIGVSSQGRQDALLRAEDVRLAAAGVEFRLELAGQSHDITSPLIGRFNVDNLLIAAGVLHAQGVEVSHIVSALRALQPVFGRMNRIRPDDSVPLVIVDYAHTPDAISQSLAALGQYEHDRIITVFGCTGDRDRGKRPEMARLVEAASDLVVVTDDDVHHEDGDRILAEIRAGFEHPDRVVELRDRGAAIAWAIGEAGADDIVLIAGKGHESYQVVGDDHIPFSDTEVAERALLARLP